MAYITGLSDSVKAALAVILSKATEFSVATGDATGGSTTTLIDTNSVWEADKWKDAIVEITHVADGKHYYPTITGNTADTLSFGALAITVAAGDHYEIRLSLRLADIDKWGGTELTGRDISLDLKALVDDSIKGILKSIGDAGEAENLLARIGEVQADPTANTVLDRLKGLLTGITLQRWQRDIDVAWVHTDEQTAPGAGTALVTKAVTAGKTGYIYGFLISTQEVNDFLINWTSGGVAKSKRIIFGGPGSTQCVDPVALNEGLGADAGTNVTITNVNAATAGKIYQANLLYGEV